MGQETRYHTFCPSDRDLMCGAIWRMNVYDTGWPMEINITSVGSSFSLFLDSTLLGVGSNSGNTFTFSVQAPGELIIKAAKQAAREGRRRKGCGGRRGGKKKRCGKKS